MSIQETRRGINRESFYRRSRLEICLDVLRAMRKGVKKPTRIMYAVNISWQPLQKYMRLMLSKGFIREIESKGDKRTKKCYEITQSGLNVLRYLDKERDFLRLMDSTNDTRKIYQK